MKSISEITSYICFYVIVGTYVVPVTCYRAIRAGLRYIDQKSLEYFNLPN